jgi:hypothetical protein
MVGKKDIQAEQQGNEKAGRQFNQFIHGAKEFLFILRK